jgi:acyl carrier protein
MDTINDATLNEGETADQELVLPDITTIIEEVIGADAAELIEITEESIFIDDLEMDSIQIVQFAEIVNERYGERVDFVNWLSNTPVTKLLKLTVGDVADFIQTNLDGTADADSDASSDASSDAGEESTDTA